MVIALRIRRASDAMINRSQSDTRILFSNGAGKWMHYPQGGPRRARITYTHTKDPYPWSRQGPPRWAVEPLGRLKSPGQNLPVGTAQDSLKALPQCVRRPALPCRNWKLFAALDLPFPLVPIACYYRRRAGLPSKFTLDALIPDRGELPPALCGPLLSLIHGLNPPLLPRMSGLPFSDRQTDLLFSHLSTLYALSALPCFFCPGAVASSYLVLLAPSC